MSIKYELIIYWSEEDRAFIVEVPELPGCMADGETYEQALANVRQVIQEWVETARDLNRPVPEPLTDRTLDALKQAQEPVMARIWDNAADEAWNSV